MAEKKYNLKLHVELIEVEDFAPPDSRRIKTRDPVERDREEISAVTDAVNVMAEHLIKPPPAPPESRLDFRRTYDVPAPSLEAAAALLKRFEETAETMGAPAAHFFEGGGGFTFPTAYGR